MIQTDQAVGRGSGRGAWTLRKRGAVGLAGLVRPHQAARGCVERRRAGRESVAWCSACSHPAQPSSPACSLCAGSADACPSSSSAGTRGGSETRPGPAWPLCAAVSQACSRPCATRCVCVLVVRLGTPRSAPCSRPRRRIQRLVRQENWAVRVGWPATEANGGADALSRVFGRGGQPGFDRVAGGMEVWPEWLCRRRHPVGAAAHRFHRSLVVDVLGQEHTPGWRQEAASLRVCAPRIAPEHCLGSSRHPVVDAARGHRDGQGGCGPLPQAGQVPLVVRWSRGGHHPPTTKSGTS